MNYSCYKDKLIVLVATTVPANINLNVYLPVKLKSSSSKILCEPDFTRWIYDE